MKPIIRVENLSKQYRIGAKQEPYGTLRDSLVNAISSPFRRLRNPTTPTNLQSNTIWALKDVSFEVQPGEVVGIIGRNGAGKSTLLKILSRITEPTSGKIDLYGRVASLLEVGTGFHAELTGRENIYLNGAILGMKRSEIERKFDEIVAFAEIEEFLDTPVKHYSSGMYMRLAFAVSAHLESEILIIDEVLAVGDAEFQTKCLGKMKEVSNQGRTVIFVSHNIVAISQLCSLGIILDKGETSYFGESSSAVAIYTRRWLSTEHPDGRTAPHVVYQLPESPHEEFAITRVEILDCEEKPKPLIKTWDDITIRIWYWAKKNVSQGSVVLEVSSFDGVRLLLLSTQPDGTLPIEFQVGEEYIDCVIENLPLSGGEYFLSVGLAIPGIEWLTWQSQLGLLIVTPNDVYKSGLAPVSSRSILALKHHWRTV